MLNTGALRESIFGDSDEDDPGGGLSPALEPGDECMAAAAGPSDPGAVLPPEQ